MGTRNLVIVFYKGQYRIVQYGQWDGQPSGQGRTVLHFLQKEGNFSKLCDALDPNKKLIFEVKQGQELDESISEHASMSRDTGAKILNLALQATEDKPMPVSLATDFIADSIFCEWIWVVDLDSETFEGYTHFSGRDAAKGKNRFEDVVGASNPVPQLIQKFKFSDLPQDDTAFVRSFDSVDYLGRDQPLNFSPPIPQVPQEFVFDVKKELDAYRAFLSSAGKPGSGS
ncbi:unnamed protein product [Sympodiomycopsis kandeliae]